MFDHRCTGGGSHQRRHRRDIDGVRLVTTSTDHVHRPLRQHLPVYPPRVREHALGKTGDLRWSLALGSKRDDESSHLRRRGRAGHHLAHRPHRVLGIQVRSGDQPGEQHRPAAGTGRRHHAVHLSPSPVAGATGARRPPSRPQPTGPAGARSPHQPATRPPANGHPCAARRQSQAGTGRSHS